jgi:superfamily II DNA/RNA helicase
VTRAHRPRQLIRDGDLKLDKVKHFVLDECDQMLEALGVLACAAA